MNWLDYVIIGFIGLSALIGMFRGFVKEVFSLFILVASFWVSSTFYLKVTPFLTQIQDKMIRNGVAMAALFVATLLLGAVVNHVINQIVDKAGLSGTNSLLGIIFGSLRGVAIVAALLFFVDAFTSVSELAEWRNSTLIPHFDGVIQWFFSQLEQVSSFLPKMPK